MDTKDIRWCPQHSYPLPCYKCGMPLSQASQKEIYKAGYDQREKEIQDVIAGKTHQPHLGKWLLPLLEEAKKIGIKEVVEWMIESCPHTTSASYFKPKCICNECKQAKLKEWGIKEVTNDSQEPR